MPIATGAALAAKLEGGDGVAVAFFGDGASNEGAFHGSLNLASIWNLPVIYVCENNRWASGNSAAATLSVEDVSVRAVGYGMPGVTVDGTDVLAVHEAAQEAVGRAREGGGPHPAGMQDLPLAHPLRVPRQPSGPATGQRDRVEPVPRSGSRIHRPPGGAGCGDQGAASAGRWGNRRRRRVRHRLRQGQPPAQPRGRPDGGIRPVIVLHVTVLPR